MKPIDDKISRMSALVPLLLLCLFPVSVSFAQTAENPVPPDEETAAMAAPALGGTAPAGEEPVLEEEPGMLLETVEPSPAAPPVEQAPPETPAAEPAEGGAPPETPPAEPAVASTPYQAPTGPIRAVVVDPGHGGRDAGMVGPAGTSEKEAVLALARGLEKVLGEAGLSVSLTRTEDRALSNSERALVAKDKKAGLLVGVHAGSSPAQAGPLFAFFHAPDDPSSGGTAALAARARAVAEAAARVLNQAGGPPVAVVRAAPLRLQSAAGAPCVLVECAALNLPGGEEALRDERQREAMAKQLGDALAAAVKEQQ